MRWYDHTLLERNFPAPPLMFTSPRITAIANIPLVLNMGTSPNAAPANTTEHVVCTPVSRMTWACTSNNPSHVLDVAQRMAWNSLQHTPTDA